MSHTVVPRKYWSEVTKRGVAARQGYVCARCRQLLSSVWVADHRVPLHLGGTNAVSNCQILCAACHAEKTQHEQQCQAAVRREKRTGVSRYWEPCSPAFVAQASAAAAVRQAQQLGLRWAAARQQKNPTAK